jgi:hypothetical protein
VFRLDRPEPQIADRESPDSARGRRVGEYDGMAIGEGMAQTSLGKISIGTEDGAKLTAIRQTG